MIWIGRLNEIILPEQIGIILDNCAITETLVLPNSFDQPGNYSVTLVAFDTGGNANTCISFVNVEVNGSDTESPTISECAELNLFVETDNLCEYVMPDYTGMVVAADNVTIQENFLITQSPIAGTILTGENVQPVIFIVTDEAGLSATCTSLLEPLDVIPPTIINCPGDITVELDGTYILPDFTTDISTYDNCSDNFDLIVLQSPVQGFEIDVLNSYEVVLSSTDENGNEATCNFSVDLIEEVVFNPICQDIDIYLDANGNSTIVPNDIDGGSTGSGDLELEISQMFFDCSDIGANSVQLIVSDDANLGTCDAIVTVLDSIAPVAICQDLSVVLESNGTVTINPNDISNGSVDNCLMFFTSGDTEFDVNNLGPNDFQLTAVDFVGNTSSCTSIVTVVAGNEEMAICTDISISLDDTGNALIVPSDVDNGSAGDIANMNIDIADFDCSLVGVNVVSLSVTFASGNISTCSSNVTVEDNINPSVSCQDIVIQLNEDGMANIPPSALELSTVDNCGAPFLNSSQIEFIEEDLGHNDVELTATDNNGNSASCTSIVTVISFEEPSFTCPGDLNLEGNGDCIIELPDFQSQCTTLNFCDEANLEYLQEPSAGSLISGTTAVTMSVTDICGNTSICSFSVTVDGLIVEIGEENGTLFTDIDADNYQWYDCGGNPIIGANMPSYTPTESGSYNVSVIANSCSGSSDCIDITIANIEETELESNLVLYPNPNFGSFKINLGSEDYQNININVLNELGQLVHIQNADFQKTLNVNLDQLPAGIYFLSVITENSRATRSFVIE